MRCNMYRFLFLTLSVYCSNEAGCDRFPNVVFRDSNYHKFNREVSVYRATDAILKAIASYIHAYAEVRCSSTQ